MEKSNQMTNIGEFEANVRVSKLLDRVERGERFTITRRRRSVAQLAPRNEKRDTSRTGAAIARLQECSSVRALDGDWKEFRDAGRKW